LLCYNIVTPDGAKVSRRGLTVTEDVLVSHGVPVGWGQPAKGAERERVGPDSVEVRWLRIGYKFMKIEKAILFLFYSMTNTALPNTEPLDSSFNASFTWSKRYLLNTGLILPSCMSFTASMVSALVYAADPTILCSLIMVRAGLFNEISTPGHVPH